MIRPDTYLWAIDQPRAIYRHSDLMKVALRSFAMKAARRGARWVPFRCDLCGGYWPINGPEKHKGDCLAAPGEEP